MHILVSSRGHQHLALKEKLLVLFDKLLLRLQLHHHLLKLQLLLLQDLVEPLQLLKHETIRSDASERRKRMDEVASPRAAPSDG